MCVCVGWGGGGVEQFSFNSVLKTSTAKSSMGGAGFKNSNNNVIFTVVVRSGEGRSACGVDIQICCKCYKTKPSLDQLLP